MNVSIQHLIKAVAASLEGEVLPHLDPQAAPASNVRACLMLLANIEARVVHEPRLLFEDNRELRALLQDASTSAETLGIDAGLRGAIAAALARHPQRESCVEFTDIAAENREYQELLTQLIDTIPAAGASPAPGAAVEFRHKLHGYLNRLLGRDMQLVDKALTRVPV